MGPAAVLFLGTPTALLRERGGREPVDDTLTPRPVGPGPHTDAADFGFFRC